MKKLNELNAIELTDVLCKIVTPMGRMMDDAEVVECFQTLAEIIKNKPAPVLFMAQCLRVVTPVFLGADHRDDTFAIISALKGVPVSDVMEQPGNELIRDMIEMLTGDGGLLRMFRPRKTMQAEENPVDLVQVRSAT